MNKTKFQTILSIFILCLSVVVFQPQTTIDAATVNTTIKNIYITHENDTTTNPWTSHETVKVHLDFSIPNNEVKQGDTSQFYLPTQLVLSKSESFEMKDDNGNLVANVYADKATKLVTITYTNYAESHSNVKGNMWFYSKFDEVKITESGTQELIFEDTSGVVYTQEIELNTTPENADELLFKSGRYADNNEGTKLQWYARVNVKKAIIPNAIFTDTPDTTYQKVDPASIVVYRVTYTITDGKFEISNHVDVTNQLLITANASTIEINFGNINGESYLVGYQTDIVNQPPIGTYLKNSIRLTGSDGLNTTYQQAVLHSGGGGMGGGEVGSLTIYKVDADNQNRLAGAVFELSNANTGNIIGNYTSNAIGMIEISNLLYDDYILVERQAPIGYELDATPIPIKINSTTMLERTIINHKTKFGSVQLEKSDNQNANLLEGAKFKLVDEQGVTLYDELVTNTFGYIRVDGLVEGDYFFIETQAPKGYMLDTTPIPFHILANDDTLILLTFTNAKIPKSVVEKPGYPSTLPPTPLLQKPSTKKERFEVKTWVNTGDETNVNVLLSLFLVSMGGIGYFYRKKKVNI